MSLCHYNLVACVWMGFVQVLPAQMLTAQHGRHLNAQQHPLLVHLLTCV